MAGFTAYGADWKCQTLNKNGQWEDLSSDILIVPATNGLEDCPLALGFRNSRASIMTVAHLADLIPGNGVCSYQSYYHPNSFARYGCRKE